jgi:hypothetical protein
MFKPQNQKYVDLQLYLKNATKYFHNFLSKFESLIISKPVLFQTFLKKTRSQRGYLQLCVVFFEKQVRGGSQATGVATSCSPLWPPR